MITKIVYFRPERRYVQDADIKELYNCVVRDEFTATEACIRMPVYLTVFQHIIPNPNRQQARNLSVELPLKLKEKMCFFLIGSKQSPLLAEQMSSDLKNIDRIEFKGHIGYEEPVFNILSQLPALRKVSFLISPCKQKNFEPDCSVDYLPDTGSHKSSASYTKNLLVTNLKITFENCTDVSCSVCNAPNKDGKIKSIESECIRNPVEDAVSKLSLEKKDTLRVIVTRILQRVVTQCPNLKNLQINVPEFPGVKQTIEDSIKSFPVLKPTKVSCANGNILVQKCVGEVNMTQALSTPCEISTPSAEKNVQIVANELEGMEPKSEPSENGNETLDQAPTVEEPESTPCLLDMSKLLGSMLGIPTSTLPSSTSPTSSDICENKFGSDAADAIFCGTEPKAFNDIQPPTVNPITTIAVTDIENPATPLDCPMNSTRTLQRSISSSSSSSPPEIITYAAAAAAAASTTNTNMTHTSSSSTMNRIHYQRNPARAGGNDIGNYNHHRLHHHHTINEGSRRTFQRVGEVLAHAEEDASKYRRKPFIPHVADLGKPVFISSSNCKSPHKRGLPFSADNLRV